MSQDVAEREAAEKKQATLQAALDRGLMHLAQTYGANFSTMLTTGQVADVLARFVTDEMKLRNATP